MSDVGNSSRLSKQALPWILIAAGLLIASTGLSDVVLSYWGRWQTARHDAAASRTYQGGMSTPRSFPPGFIGELEIPRLASTMLVVDATKSERALRRGPGIIAGSAGPGQRENCLIAGHRDLHFRILKDIRVGDDIIVESPSGSFKYRVFETGIVKPTDNASLQATYPGQLTLITCYPFYYVGPAPKRFIVKATLQRHDKQPQ